MVIKNNKPYCVSVIVGIPIIFEQTIGAGATLSQAPASAPSSSKLLMPRGAAGSSLTLPAEAMTGDIQAKVKKGVISLS